MCIERESINQWYYPTPYTKTKNNHETTIDYSGNSLDESFFLKANNTINHNQSMPART
jgi:hypothetical protein